GHIDVPVAGRHENSIRALDLMRDDTRQLAVRVDPINALDQHTVSVAHFHIIAAAVAWVAEVDAPFGVNGQVIGRIVAMALIGVSEVSNGAAGLWARGSPVARFAHDEAPLPVKQQAVRAAGGFAEDRHRAVQVATGDAIRTGEVQALDGMPGGTFPGADGA